MKTPPAGTGGVSQYVGYRTAEAGVNLILLSKYSISEIPRESQGPERRFPAMEANQSRFAHGEPPKRPRRAWDELRQTWVESIVFRRESNGQWAKKDGEEPSAQLVLFPVSNN